MYSYSLFKQIQPDKNLSVIMHFYLFFIFD